MRFPGQPASESKSVAGDVSDGASAKARHFARMRRENTRRHCPGDDRRSFGPKQIQGIRINDQRNGQFGYQPAHEVGHALTGGNTRADHRGLHAQRLR